MAAAGLVLHGTARAAWRSPLAPVSCPGAARLTFACVSCPGAEHVNLVDNLPNFAIKLIQDKLLSYVTKHNETVFQSQHVGEFKKCQSLDEVRLMVAHGWSMLSMLLKSAPTAQALCLLRADPHV